MVTMVDVAKAAGVSIATVSRVVNGTPVRADLAQAVNKAIEDLQYSPNRSARALRRRVSTVVALIVADIENPFFTSFARGVEDVTQSADLSLVLCNSDEDPAKESQYLRTVIEERMAGVILVPASSKTTISPLLERSIAVVIADRLLDQPADHVYFDNFKLGVNATRCLLSNGFTRIACVTGPDAVPTAVERAAGWKSELLAASLAEGASRIFYTDFRIEGGYRACQELLASKTPPDAIVAANNMVGVGVLRALGMAGRRDIAVSIIGDLPCATTVQPNVWLTPLNTADFGKAAATMLVQRLKGEAPSAPRFHIQDVPTPIAQIQRQIAVPPPL